MLCENQIVVSATEYYNRITSISFSKKLAIFQPLAKWVESAVAISHWLRYTSLCRYLRILPVLHRADVVGIFIFVGVYTILKHVICQRDYRLQSFLSMHCVHGDL